MLGGFVPDLYLDKRVVIHNGRLNIFFNILRLLCLTGMCCKVWYTGELFSEYYEDDSLMVSIFPRAEEAFVNAVETGTVPYCEPGERDKYNYGLAMENTNRIYTNMSCLFATVAPIGGEPDIALQSLYKQDLDGTVMVKTHSQTVSSQPGATEQNHFYPGAEGVTLAISYSYKVPKYDLFGNRQTGDPMIGSSETQRTALINSHGEALRVLPSGVQTIQMTVSDLLSNADIVQALDDERPIAGANEEEGSSFKAGPPGRVSGLGLNVEVSCYNDPWKLPDEVQINTETGVGCTVKVVHTNEAWVENTNHYYDGNTWQFETLRGIRIKGVARVEVKFFSGLAAFTNMVALLVLLRFPRIITRFVACRLLGLSSKIIRRATYDEFDVKKQIGASVARLICFGAQFLELADPDKDGDQGIDERMVMDRISHVLHNVPTKEPLTTNDVTSFGHSCFLHLALTNTNRMQAGELAESKIFHSAFYEALTNGEVLTSKEVVELANSSSGNRKPRFIENLFLTEAFRDVMYAHSSHSQAFVSQYSKTVMEDKQRKQEEDARLAKLPPDEAEKEKEKMDREKFAQAMEAQKNIGRRPQTLEERKEAIWHNFKLVTELSQKVDFETKEIKYLVEQMTMMQNKLENSIERGLAAMEIKFEAVRSQVTNLELVTGPVDPGNMGRRQSVRQQEITDAASEITSITGRSRISAPRDELQRPSVLQVSGRRSETETGVSRASIMSDRVGMEFAESLETHVNAAKREAAKSSARAALVAAGVQVSLRLLTERIEAQLNIFAHRLDELERVNKGTFSGSLGKMMSDGAQQVGGAIAEIERGVAGASSRLPVVGTTSSSSRT